MPKRKTPDGPIPAEAEPIPDEISGELTVRSDFETPENLKKRTAAEHKETAAGIEEAERRIGEHRKKTNEPAGAEAARYGDFADQVTEKGMIALTKEQTAIAETFIEKTKTEDRFSPPSLLIGQKAATEYASRARSFSTRTRILELPDGRRVFVIHNYPLSGIHRELDAFGKWTAGAPMRKAKSKDWKKAVEEKSNIPTIECGDPDVVLMPFVENVNANDLFAFNHEIEDFGAMPDAKNYGMKRKILLSDKIVDELAGIHAKGTAWGEAILANMIIAKDGRPIVVDPEVRYDEGVPLPEQKARDILDFIHSLVSALRKSEKEFDIEAVVRHVIDRYPDKTVIDEFPRIAKDKSKWYRKLLRPIHELPRLGQNRKDYNAVLKVLLEQ
jgi:tRNA A-37 threonylcarbamoyl transferase component Bud32